MGKISYKLLTFICCCMICLVCSSSANTHIFGFLKKKAKVETKDTTKKTSAYDKLFKAKHETVKGMITLHKMNGKVYFELPVNLLGCEMLIGSTVSEISDNADAVVGSKPTDPIHVIFTKTPTNVQLREVNTDYVTSNANIDKALEQGKIGAILKNAKIAAYNADSTSVVFEMTDFFVADNKKMTPFDKYGLNANFKRDENFKSDRSYLTAIKAFEDNVVIKSVLSYTYSLTDSWTGKSLVKDKPFTVEMTRSIVLLPKKPYMSRMADYRIGVFFTEKRQLGINSQSSAPIYYANRWQLVPSDSAAYRRGEKVTPVKPIVFYVDNNFPDKWKPYIMEGVNQWSELFEQIGFKNAIVAKEFPVDDPSFDPDNIKYSCIRYAPIGIQNAMGPSWVDPRSGEIITASVYVYHDVVKLINNWLFVQTATVNKDIRKVQAPDKDLFDAFRYVISHEIGHCLGFMHNMSGSSVIPVDSLRSPSFTQKHGTTSSIMDYARFNYVAQPGDKERGVALTPPRFGDYDRYLIRWTYTPVLDAKTTEEEAPITTKWVTDAMKNPINRYGKQQLYSVLDPRCQTEDLGDDAVKATEYGIKNLKLLMKNYDSWITEGDDDFEFRTDVLNSIINQYAMYANHVYNNVGGLYINQVKTADTMPAFENMSKDKQVRALKYLFSMYNDLDWFDNKALMNKLSIMGSPKSALENFMFDLIFVSPFRVSAVADVTMKTFSFKECEDMVYDFAWAPTAKGVRPTKSQMEFQRMYVNAMLNSGGFKVPGASSNGITGHSVLPASSHCTCCETDLQGNFTYNPVAGFEWSPRSIFHRGQATVADVYAYLLKVKNLLNSKVATAPSDVKSHYELLIRTLELGLK